MLTELTISRAFVILDLLGKNVTLITMTAARPLASMVSFYFHSNKC